jgi:hypothetical protein
MIDGQIILEFRAGELVAIRPIAGSDQEARLLLEQLRKAAAIGDLSGIRDDAS